MGLEDGRSAGAGGGEHGPATSVCRLPLSSLTVPSFHLSESEPESGFPGLCSGH